MLDDIKFLGNYPNDRQINDMILYYEARGINVTYTEEDITKEDAWKYQGDFVGLMMKLNVEPKWFMLMQYMNGIMNPYDYDGIETRIKKPDSIGYRYLR